MSASRTNLTSQVVQLRENEILGQGAFRVAYAGTYIGGNRNGLEAVCKRFLDYYRILEQEFFATDFRVADKAIEYASEWNSMCDQEHKILITKGDVKRKGERLYLVEPLIRYFVKFTSNNGWIAHRDDVGWTVELMEAFSHFTYHRSGGQMIVCDLQGRYRFNRYARSKSRFELTDVAICSRRRSYGPTDLAEKGIETFFCNHKCNGYCHMNGYWSSPRSPQRWFESTSQTSMLGSASNRLLQMSNPVRFNANLETIDDYGEYDSDADYSDESDEYVPIRY